MDDDPLVLLEEVLFSFENSEFSLEVPRLALARRESVACIGASGTGKTTLVQIMAGILPPQKGRVRLAGAWLTDLPEARRRAHRIRTVGLVFQEFELLDYLSGLDNILLPYHLSKDLSLDREARERALDLASAMGISHVLKRRPDRLSQGERQRLAICRALVTKPLLVLADEPTGNLDPRSTERTLDLLFQETEKQAATLLMVTHDHRLLSRFERVVDVEQLQPEEVS